MGKALLLLILGAGLILVQQGISAMENETVTQRNQLGFQEEVLAREIAVSAFNVAMGELRSHQEDVYAAVAAFNGPNGAGRTGTYASGKYAGGRYTVRAELQSGHSIKVIATGSYGGTDYTMHDAYRVPVLIARDQGRVHVSFIDSQAGYCSAVFMQRYLPGVAPADQPAPEMIFAADNRDRRASRPAVDVFVTPGTQMNFFIAVSKNCSQRYESSDPCTMRRYVHGYQFLASRFDHVHFGLDIEAASLDQARESAWGLVEQHPANRQRWRIGWEDQHITAWANRDEPDPAKSLFALKRLGYDGRGWPDRDSRGYRLLRDYGNRPDYSDQVIEVSVEPLSDAQMAAARRDAEAEDVSCGIAPPPPPPAPPDPTPSVPDPSAPPPSGPNPSPSPPEPTEASCPCRGTKKVYLFHRPPGNENNPQQICISENGLSGHKNHNDYVICRGT